MLTLYFSDVDTAGHRHGPTSAELAEAVTKVDRSIGSLVDSAGEGLSRTADKLESGGRALSQCAPQ